jgi:hypothetical protein
MSVYLPVHCRGEEHELEISDTGELLVLDHDVEEELAMAAFGAELPRCMVIVDTWKAKGPMKAIGMSPLHGVIHPWTLALVALDWAEHVLPYFERAHPGDMRARAAIEASRDFMAARAGVAQVKGAGKALSPGKETAVTDANALQSAMWAATWSTSWTDALESWARVEVPKWASRVAIWGSRGVAYLALAPGRQSSYEAYNMWQYANNRERQWQLRRLLDVLQAADRGEPYPPLEATQ